MKSKPSALDIDYVLTQPLLCVPENFAQEVMQAIEPLPTPLKRLSLYIQWLALFSAMAMGIEQVLSFIFGLWLVQSLS